jgi:hypothetical protein
VYNEYFNQHKVDLVMGPASYCDYIKWTVSGTMVFNIVDRCLFDSLPIFRVLRMISEHPESRTPATELSLLGDHVLASV